jgi:hypothetical protein
LKHKAVRFARGRGGRTGAERGKAVLGELRAALAYLVSFVAFVVEVISM